MLLEREYFLCLDRKFSAEEKIKTVENILEGKESMSTAAKRLGIDWTTVRAWIISYKSNGLDAFTHVKK